MARVTTPMIARVLEARVAKVEGNLQKVTECEIQTTHLNLEYEKVLERSRGRAHENLMASITKVTAASAKRKRDINDTMLARIQTSELNIEKRKRAAFDSLKKIAESVAVGVVEKLTDLKVNNQSLTKVLNEVIEHKVA